MRVGIHLVARHAGNATRKRTRANANNDLRALADLNQKIARFLRGRSALNNGNIEFIGQRLIAHQLPIPQVNLTQNVQQVRFLIRNLQLAAKAAGEREEHNARHAFAAQRNSVVCHITSTPECS